jgi:protein SCO1
MRRLSRTHWLVLGASLLLVAAMAGVIAARSRSSSKQSAAAGQTTGYHGGVLTTPLEKPEFTLTDTSGAPFDFRKATDGSVTMLYFGYTNCPDICPLHMANIAAVLGNLPPDVTRQIMVVFVTTDPERDTPERLRSWLDRFDKRFVGLTGSEEALNAAQAAASVPAAQKESTDPVNYSVSHAAFVIAYGKDNLARVLYPAGIRQSDWAHDLAKLVKETGGAS